jgi:hypothetical protein
MSLEHVFAYPRVTEIARRHPAVIAHTARGAEARDRPTQREMVVASLLRCPGQTHSAKARKRA